MDEQTLFIMYRDRESDFKPYQNDTVRNVSLYGL